MWRCCKPRNGVLSMQHGYFQRSFASELFHVKSVLFDALGFIRTQFAHIPEEDERELRLVISELLLNAVIHGNRGDTRKAVSIALTVRGETVYGSVVDEGDGFDHASLLASFSADCALDAEHGRGVRLACALTDSLGFNTAGNAILFEKRVCVHE